MAQIKITQKKSAIGRTLRQKRTVKALGLKRINDSIIHNDTPAVKGMINKVRHLIEIEEAE